MSYLPIIKNGLSENQLLTYELVKEYNLVNESINDTFNWDSEYENCYIELAVKTTNNSTSNLSLFLNNDTVESNYIKGQISHVDNVPNGEYVTSQKGLILLYGTILDRTFYNTVTLSLQSNNYKFCRCQLNHYSPNLVNQNVFEITNIWLNNTDAVNTITINSDTLTLSGNIKIYRRVKVNAYFPTKLIHNQSYTAQDINLNIDMTDCEGLEIECYGITNNTTGIRGIFNGDSNVNNYRTSLINSNNTALSASTTSSLVYISGISTHIISKRYLTITTDKFIYEKAYVRTSSGNLYNIDAKREYIGSGNINTFNISGTGFTGKLKIWKKY